MVAADVYCVKVTIMNESVVRTGLLPLLVRVGVTVLSLLLRAVVPFCTGLLFCPLTVVTAGDGVSGMSVIPFKSVVTGSVVFASVTLNWDLSGEGAIVLSASVRQILKLTSTIRQQLRATAERFMNASLLRFFSSKYSFLRRKTLRATSL